MHQLTALDLRRSRVNLPAIKLAYTAALGALVLAEIALAPEGFSDVATRPPLGSAAYLAMGLQITAFLLPVAIWRLPRLTLLWTVPVAWLIPLGESSVPTLWHGLAAACAVALVWMLIKGRPVESGGGRRRTPLVDHTYEESFARVETTIPRIALLLGGVLPIVLVVVHQFLVADTAAFEARAQEATAEVVRYDADAEELVLRVDGQEVRVAEPWSLPEDGTNVSVLLDPQDREHVVLVSELEDHSWLIGLAVAAPLAGMFWGLSDVLRDRRRRALLQRGGPVVAARYLLGESADQLDGGRILPVDGTWPALVIKDLEAVTRGAKVASVLERAEEAYGEDDDDEPEPLPIPDDDAELIRFADAMARGEEDFADDGLLADQDRELLASLTGPDVEGPQAVLLVGPRTVGSSVAVVLDGGVWLGEVAEPPSRRGFQRHLAGAVPESGPAPELHPVRGWLARNFSWGRWVGSIMVALSGGLLLPWLLSEDFSLAEDWLSVLPLLAGLLYLPFRFFAESPAQIGRSRRGLVYYGLFLDDVVARDRVVSVLAGEATAVVRLRDPDDAIVLLPEELIRGGTAEQAAARIRGWLDSAPGDAKSGRVPSPMVVAAVLMVLIWVVLLPAVVL